MSSSRRWWSASRCTRSPGPTRPISRARRWACGPSVYPATTLLIPLLVARRRAGLGPYPFVADIALGIPFALDAGANVFGLFAIKGFDAHPALGRLVLPVDRLRAGGGSARLRALDSLFGLVLRLRGRGSTSSGRSASSRMMRSGGLGPPADVREHDPGPGRCRSVGAAVGALVMATVLWPGAWDAGDAVRLVVTCAVDTVATCCSMQQRC